MVLYVNACPVYSLKFVHSFLPNRSLCLHIYSHQIDPSGCQCHTRCHRQKNCPCKCAGQCCLPTCHPRHTCTNNGHKLTSPSTDLTEQMTTIGVIQQKWRNCYGIHLTEKHKNILLSTNEWLDDDIVNVTEFMLIQQHQEVHVGGLQSTVLPEKFAMEPQSGEFVQILNIKLTTTTG